MLVINGSETRKWQCVLDLCQRYDWYHTAEYHAYTVQDQPGDSYLLVFKVDAKIIALPIVLRPLGDIPGLDSKFTDYYDVTSVYGYSGPIASCSELPPNMLQAFHIELEKQLKAMQVVTSFARLHPILANDTLLQGLGQVVSMGETVSIDLTIPSNDQFAAYRKSHRYEVRQAHKAGIQALHDQDWQYADTFLSLYNETMDRVGADASYFLDRAELDALRSALGSHLNLFVALDEQEIYSAALFTEINHIVQYHLSGSSTSRLNFAASKTIIDEVRRWATRRGNSVFHLGGGVSARQDGLFAFKAGFSAVRHQFKLWQYIVNPSAYQAIITHQDTWLKQVGRERLSTTFFPIYRANHTP